MGNTKIEEAQTPKTGSRPPLLKSIVALFLWIGMIQFNILLLASTFFLPLCISALIIAFLVLMGLVPLNPESKFGSKVAKFISKNAYGYFSITVQVEDEQAFDPDQAYVFGYEPHTIFAPGAWALTELGGLAPVPRIKLLASSLVFNIPILRHIWAWLGLVPVTRENFINQLKAGNSCIVIPGGVREMLYLEHDSEVVFLRTRKGFVKLAIEMGCSLVPVFSFGDSQAYKWWRPQGEIFHKIYKLVKQPIVLFWGRFGSPIPFRVPLHIVIGKPIQLKKNAQPTDHEVNEVHAQFVAAMQELFEKHKAQHGFKDLQLRVV